MPASEYWDYQLIQNYICPRATFGEELCAPKLKALLGERIPTFRREDIHVEEGSMTLFWEDVPELVRQSPAEGDIEELIYQLYLLEKLPAAEANITARWTHSAKEVREHLRQWQS